MAYIQIKQDTNCHLPSASPAAISAHQHFISSLLQITKPGEKCYCGECRNMKTVSQVRHLQPRPSQIWTWASQLS